MESEPTSAGTSDDKVPSGAQSPADRRNDQTQPPLEDTRGATTQPGNGQSANDANAESSSGIKVNHGSDASSD